MQPNSISTIAVLRGKALTLVLEKQKDYSKKKKNRLSKSSAIQILLSDYADYLERMEVK